MFSQARFSPDCTGYEPTKRLLFSHQKPSTSAVLTPQCRVAIVAYSRGRGGGGGGVLIENSWWRFDKRFSNILIPDFKSKTRQFPHLFSDLVFKSSTQFCEPITLSNVKISLNSVRMIYFVCFSFFCIHLELFGVEKINKFIQCRGFLENHTQF